MRCTQKEVREKLGISRDTLRLYEQKGIIYPEVDPANGYRYYDDWQVNLLWDCKHYQAMGFSLAQIAEILQSDSMERLTSRVDARADEVECQIQREQLELAALRARCREMSEAEVGLGTFALEDFTGRVYFAAREDHEFCAEVDTEAVAFMNAHLSLMEPLLWFPRLEENHFFWGYALPPSTHAELLRDVDNAQIEPGHAGVTAIEPARALSTWIDAGERWSIGLELFEPLLSEAGVRGLEPRGEICADLIARAHGADGYHRYLHVYLPLK